MNNRRTLNYDLEVVDVRPWNVHEKFLSAVGVLSKAMQIDAAVEIKDKANGERFRFVAEEELVKRWIRWFGVLSDAYYTGVCDMLGIPQQRVRVKKAMDPNDVTPLRYNGRPVYSATGQPITQKQWIDIVAAIEKFLNRNMRDKEKQIVLESAQLGKMISRLSAQGITRKIELAIMADVEREWKRFDKMGAHAKRVKDLFRLEPEQAWAMEIAQQQAGQLIRESGDKLKNGVRRVLIQATKERWPASRVSQQLYENMGEANRDWRRVAESEIVEAMNVAFIRDQVSMADAGEKVYFRRHEIVDAVTCSYCTKINGTVALFVEQPMDDDRIDDPFAKIAIWPGKSNVGRKKANWWVPIGPVHPHCRGSWEQHAVGDEEDEIDRMINAGRKKLDEDSRRWGEVNHGNTEA